MVVVVAKTKDSELTTTYHSHLLASTLPECLRPFDLPWVSLLDECLVALRSAESERL